MSAGQRDLITMLRSARVFDLSQPLESTIPSPTSIPTFSQATLTRHGDFVLPGGTSFLHELISMGTHTGTHIDALNHVSCDGVLHGGEKASEGGRVAQEARLGIEFAPCVFQGIVLDIPAVRQVDRLQSGEAVTADDLNRARKAQGVELEAGAAVLVRTGWGQRDFYRTREYLTRPPGVDLSGAKYLVERGVKLTGSDTFMYEQPHDWPGPMPVHAELIVGAGVHIVENLYLDDLVGAGAYEFGLVLAPLKIVGASGSPIRPLALVAAAL